MEAAVFFFFSSSSLFAAERERAQSYPKVFGFEAAEELAQSLLLRQLSPQLPQSCKHMEAEANLKDFFGRSYLELHV